MQFPSYSGIYSDVKEEYGLQALQAVRYYVRSASKESRLRQHIAFSQRCRCYNLAPCSLTVRPLVPTHEGHQIAARASCQFPVACIQHDRLRRLETDLYFQKCQLEHTVHSQNFASIEQHKEQVQVKVKTSCKDCQKKKFDALAARQSLG